MYEYKKRQSKFKRIFLNFILIVIVAAASIFIYDMYTNIDVYSAEEEENKAIKLSSNKSDIQSEEEDTTKILEKTIKCVVGISKIKNTGSSFCGSAVKDPVLSLLQLGLLLWCEFNAWPKNFHMQRTQPPPQKNIYTYVYTKKSTDIRGLQR